MEAVAGTSKISAPQSPNAEITESNTREKQKELRDVFKCSSCNLEEYYDYKGTKPPFAKHLTYTENCYIMKDPFSASNKSKVLILGSDCSMCKNATCLECSLYYAKRFCKICALNNIQHFPSKLQEKIRLFDEEFEEDL